LGRLRCELDQAHASLFPFLSFSLFFIYKNKDQLPVSEKNRYGKKNVSEKNTAKIKMAT
jgi:hypothetical protein